MTEEKKEIHRGDIYFADLSPTVGCEKGGISVPIKLNDIGNLYSPTVIVAPITGRAKKWLPTHAILHCTGLDKRSCVLLEQLRTKDKDRLVDYIGRLEQSQLSSVKRWCKRYDGGWRSLREQSHRPHKHPNQHTRTEERKIIRAFSESYLRYGWDGVYDSAVKLGYKRSFSGMVYAAKRMGLVGEDKVKKVTRKQERRYPEILTPGEKVQIDVKEVPYNCLRGSVLRDNKHLYQWTAIDECTRIRFIYGFEEHTPENSVKFLKMLVKVFPFKIKTIQTDNGTEFTYKYISDTEKSPFDKALEQMEIQHILIPPRTPWHNGKVERSHRNDQRYFYDWEIFRSVEELNIKLKTHLHWSNNKTMRTLGRKSPIQLLKEKLAA